MTSLITVEGIDQAISGLNHRNKDSLKYKLINAIRRVYEDNASIKAIHTIDAGELIKALWGTEHDPAIIKKRRKSLSAVKYSVNVNLKELYKEGKNPEGIIIGPGNIFSMSDEAKDKALQSIKQSMQTDGAVTLDKITDILNIVSETLSDPENIPDAKGKEGLKKLVELKDVIRGLSNKFGMGVAEPTDSAAAASFPETEKSSDISDISGGVEFGQRGSGDKAGVEGSAGGQDKEGGTGEKETPGTGKGTVDRASPGEHAGPAEGAGPEADETEEVIEEADDLDIDEEEPEEDVEELDIDDTLEELEEVESLEEDEVMEELEDAEVEEVEDLETDEEEIEEEVEYEGIDEEDVEEELEEVELDDALEEIDAGGTGNAGDSDVGGQGGEYPGGPGEGGQGDDGPQQLEGGMNDKEAYLSDLREAEEAESSEEDEIIGEPEGVDIEQENEEEGIAGPAEGTGPEADETEEVIEEADDLDIDEEEPEEDVEELDIDDTLEELDEEEVDEEDEVMEELEDAEVEEVEDMQINEEELEEDLEEVELLQGASGDEEKGEGADKGRAAETGEGGMEEFEGVNENADPDAGCPGSEFLADGCEESDKIKKARVLAEKFNRYLGVMDRFYNQYILIPEGNYVIGAKQPKVNEKPEQKIHLSEFYMGKFPITNALFEIFVEKTGYRTIPEKLGYGTVYKGRFRKSLDEKTGLARYTWNSSVTAKTVEGACWYQPLGPGSTLHNRRNHPVVQITLEDAMAFAAWTGKRLPTEAEWEAASRLFDGLELPWGNSWAEGFCNTEENSVGDTTPVDRYMKSANGIGIVDTIGNVLEWTSDRAGPPSSTNNGSRHCVVKGGSWISGNDVRLFSRFKLESGSCSNILGFRCVAY